jgi:CBS domain-containing protein
MRHGASRRALRKYARCEGLGGNPGLPLFVGYAPLSRVPLPELAICGRLLGVRAGSLPPARCQVDHWITAAPLEVDPDLAAGHICYCMCGWSAYGIDAAPARRLQSLFGPHKTEGQRPREALTRSEEETLMNIQQIMSKPAVTCRQNDTLNVAARLMWEHDCGVIPVTDDDGKLIGIVTDRDICMATYTKGTAPQAIPVSDVMGSQVFTCQADDTLDAAERLMSEKQIHRVPIIDRDNRPVGLLSLNDVARYAVSASARRTNGLDREVTQTLAAICQPRPQASQALPQAQQQQPTAM